MHEINQTQPTRYALNPFEASVAFHNRKKSFDLLHKSNDSFLYKVKHWAEMGQKFIVAVRASHSKMLN